MNIFISVLIDMLPILAVLFGFQFLVLREKPPHLSRIIFGFVLVWLGLSLFLVGLNQSLFPIGKLMANQLVSVDFLGIGDKAWGDYIWVYVFAAAIGFTTTIAEPSLLAVAIKAKQVSGGSIKPFALRVVVALGVAFGIALGSFRIVAGIPIYYFIISGYVVVIILTAFSPKAMVGLAYDCGGVTTSTVTVPIVAALGLGLSDALEYSNPLFDGFGLIAFASLFPIISVLLYAYFSIKLSHKGE